MPEIDSYLAVPSHWYCTITQLLAGFGIIKNKKDLGDAVHRVVYEKPFGFDAASAHELNECIKSFCEENQVFRVDHYLTKALTTSLCLLRFSNIFFGGWNNKHINRIQILLNK